MRQPIASNILNLNPGTFMLIGMVVCLLGSMMFGLFYGWTNGPRLNFLEGRVPCWVRKGFMVKANFIVGSAVECLIYGLKPFERSSSPLQKWNEHAHKEPKQPNHLRNAWRYVCMPPPSHSRAGAAGAARSIRCSLPELFARMGFDCLDTSQPLQKAPSKCVC